MHTTARGAGFSLKRARLYCPRRNSSGGMAEWLKAHAWKACIRETVSWVRIPLPPPAYRPPSSVYVQEIWNFLRILRLRTCRHVCHNRRIKRWYGRWSTVRFRRAQMGRTLHRLSPTKVRTAKDTGMYADGGGLYLQVKVGADGRINKSWLFRYAIPETAISANGIERQKERQMGLGSLDTISLAEAREAAVHCRKLRVQGIDPIAARDAERTKAALEAARAMTFDQCRDAYIAAHRAGWRNVKHASQWTNTLTTYATPVFGKLPVAAIDTALVMKVVEPLWAVKPETASRVRGRIEVILDWATVRGFRQGDNPARWRGHLDKLLPARSKVRKVVNHAALPYGEIGPFMADL